MSKYSRPLVVTLLLLGFNISAPESAQSAILPGPHSAGSQCDATTGGRTISTGPQTLLANQQFHKPVGMAAEWEPSLGIMPLTSLATSASIRRGLMVFQGGQSDTRIQELARSANQAGANLLRWEIFWDSGQIPDRDLEFDRLYRNLPYINSLGMEVVVALMRWHHSQDPFNASYAHQQELIDYWSAAAVKFRGQSGIYGFDLMNEPRGQTRYWRPVAVAVTSAVTAIDNQRRVIVEALNGDPERLAELTPFRHGEVIYSFHMYLPLAFTHQFVDGAWPNSYNPNGGIYNQNGAAHSYPGTIAGEYWDKRKLRRVLRAVLDYQSLHGVKIFVGEFSAARWASGAELYLSDLISLFEQWRWDWSYHAWQESTVWDVEMTSDPNNSSLSELLTSRWNAIREGLKYNHLGTRSFSVRQLWAGNGPGSGHTVRLGDANGDGVDDVINFTHGPTNDVFVYAANGIRFGNARRWHNSFSFSGETPDSGDFNGDGIDDIITFVSLTGQVWVALSNGSSFLSASLWLAGFSSVGATHLVADANGDGRDDILSVDPVSGIVRVAISSGVNFGSATSWLSGFSSSTDQVDVGDFNGDGAYDLVAFSTVGNYGVRVALSTGVRFLAGAQWTLGFSPPGNTPTVGNVNGDNYSDIITFTHGASNDVYVGLSTGSSFGSSTKWHSGFGPTPEAVRIGDVNGDGVDDLVGMNSITGEIYSATSRY